MPPSKITADETDQVYWGDKLVVRRSVGGSGGIFRGRTHLLPLYQTRWVSLISLTRLRRCLFQLKISTPQKLNQLCYLVEEPTAFCFSSQYSRLSARASQLASMILVELPTVLHSSTLSLDSIRTRT